LSTRIDRVTGEEIELDEAMRSYHTGEKAPVKLPLLLSAGVQGGASSRLAREND